MIVCTRTLIKPVINILSKSSSIRFDCSARVVKFSLSSMHLAKQLASDICVGGFLYVDLKKKHLHSKQHSIIFHAYFLHTISDFKLCEVRQLRMNIL